MKKQDSYKSILGILLVVYIATIVAFNIMTSDKVFSESENRVLEQVPRFSISQLMDGRFTTNYEKYISDQFPLRDFWIGVKSTIEKVLGKKENNQVYLARDGYLMEKFEDPDKGIFKSKVDRINSLISDSLDIDKYFMLIPNSVKVLENKLPPYAPNGDQLVYINKMKKSVNKDIKFINVYDTLYSHKDEYIFYRTDHHWTTKGAYLAYKQLITNMGIKPHKEDYFNIDKITDDFYGSLYSKSGFRNIEPDTIQLYRPKKDEGIRVEYVNEKKVIDSIYNLDNLRKKDKYTIFLDGNYPLIKINSNIDNKEKLLIIKDSYANSIIPFLTGHFNEIYVVDLRYYDDNIEPLIKNNKIDSVLILYNVKTFFMN